MRVTVKSSPHNARLAAQLREVSTTELRKRNIAALKAAAVQMAAGVTTDVPQYMPHRGGYAGLLAGSLKASVTAQADGVTIRESAKGKRQPRDIKSLERGRLRHPTYGRRRSRRGKSLMFDTTVRPGFFTKPITDRAHIARDKLVAVAQEIAKQITRGS